MTNIAHGGAAGLPAGLPTRAVRRPIARHAAAVVILAGMLSLGTGGAARAAESDAVSVPGAEVRLLSAGGDGAVREAGIEIRLQPHYKTYWRYPGDSGVPPVISFEGSRNVADVSVAWPVPRRFSDGSEGHSIGYKRGVLFPLKVTLKDPAKPARLDLAMDFAVCEALCMPANARLTVDLDGDPDAAAARRIADAAAKVPEPAALGAAGAPSILSATIDESASPPRLVVEVRVMTPKADLFVEGPDGHWALPLPQKTALPGGLARFILPVEGMPPGADARKAELTFTLADKPRSVTVTAVPGGS